MLVRSWLERLTSAFRTPTYYRTGRRHQRRWLNMASYVESLEYRIVLAAPASFDLASLLPANGGDGSTGSTIFGIDTDDVRWGGAVSHVGDLNGDGFDDLLIGARFGGGTENVGESYVVFGRADWSTTPTVNLASLNGTNGFAILGIDAYDYSGEAVSGAGDVNGDGFDDLLIGARWGGGSGNAKLQGGESYVVFGKANWTDTPMLDLATLNGNNGFTLFGVDTADQSGRAVSGGGDVNGDGFDDLLIGASGGDAAGNLKSSAGESYVVFGRAYWSATPTLDLGTLNGANGFSIFGVDVDDESGSAVSGAGDVNGDGFDDLLIGASLGDAAVNTKSRAGESYVVFGKADWSTTPIIDLSALNGTDGFTLFGIDIDDWSGSAVSGAGDVNGDGFDDLLIGARSAASVGNTKPVAGESYVVFGKANWSSTPTVDLATLNGINGFTLFGIDPRDFSVGTGDFSGSSVSSAGDVNADGFDDILIGAPGGHAAGNAKRNAGESYIVFGKASWSSTPALDLATLNGNNGFTVYGVDVSDRSGSTVSGAGDVNGDGVDDFLIGASGSGMVGHPASTAGVSYIVFGRILGTGNPINTNPVFESGATATISENTKTATTVIATDSDIPAQIVSYSVTGGADQGLFVITVDGVLSFKSAPDFEAPADNDFDNVYEVQVTANDGQLGATVQTITITVMPVNDNTPIFLTPPPTFTIPAISAIGTVVGGVQAADADQPGQSLTYAITGGNADGAFLIDPATGEISVADSTVLNFGTNPVFILTILATDNGSPQLSKPTTVTIKLKNVNEIPRLQFTGGPVTSVKGKAVTILPTLAVIGGQKLPDGGTLTIIADAVTTTKKNKVINVDKYAIPSFSKLGTGNKANIENGQLILEIHLKQNVTVAAIQSFLRGIRFSTKSSGLNVPTRTLTVSLAHGGESSSSISQTIKVYKTTNQIDHLPVAVADTLTVAEDSGTTSGNLADNDTPSSDGGNFWSLTTSAANGISVVNPNGTYTYTPHANFNGPDSFTYTLTDADGDTTAVAVTITVTPIEDDTLGPDIQLISPAPGLLTQENVTVAGRANDNLAGVASVQAQLDDGAPFNVSIDESGNFSFNTDYVLDGTSDGTHTIRVSATDVVGNISVEEVTFVLKAATVTQTLTIGSTSPSGETPSILNPGSAYTITGSHFDLDVPTSIELVLVQNDATISLGTVQVNLGANSFSANISMPASLPGGALIEARQGNSILAAVQITVLHDVDTVQELFTTAFGRNPGPVNISYWQTRTDKVGTALLGAMESARLEYEASSLRMQLFTFTGANELISSPFEVLENNQLLARFINAVPGAAASVHLVYQGEIVKSAEGIASADGTVDILIQVPARLLPNVFDSVAPAGELDVIMVHGEQATNTTLQLREGPRLLLKSAEVTEGQRIYFAIRGVTADEDVKVTVRLDYGNGVKEETWTIGHTDGSNRLESSNAWLTAPDWLRGEAQSDGIEIDITVGSHHRGYRATLLKGPSRENIIAELIRTSGAGSIEKELSVLLTEEERILADKLLGDDWEGNAVAIGDALNTVLAQGGGSTSNLVSLATKGVTGVVFSTLKSSLGKLAEQYQAYNGLATAFFNVFGVRRHNDAEQGKLVESGVNPVGMSTTSGTDRTGHIGEDYRIAANIPILSPIKGTVVDVNRHSGYGTMSVTVRVDFRTPIDLPAKLGGRTQTTSSVWITFGHLRPSALQIQDETANSRFLGGKSELTYTNNPRINVGQRLGYIEDWGPAETFLGYDVVHEYYWGEGDGPHLHVTITTEPANQAYWFAGYLGGLDPRKFVDPLTAWSTIISNMQ